MSFVSMLDEGLAYFFPHLVYASRFVMLAAHHRVASNTLVYRMSLEIVMFIRASLPNLEDDY
jgi:hypothetical protein